MKKLPKNRKNLNNAFTLIELVIAISIFGVILSLSYRVFSQLNVSKQLLDEERDINKISYSLLSRLTREIQHALEKQLLAPPDQSSNAIGTRVFLLSENKKLANGNPGDSLTFVAKDAGQYIRGQRQQAGISQITYRVENDPDQENTEANKKTFLLIRDETPYLLPAKKAFKETLTFPISYNVQGLQFIFYDGSNKTWREEWTLNDQDLPQLVKFNLTLLSATGKEYSYSAILPIKPRE